MFFIVGVSFFVFSPFSVSAQPAEETGVSSVFGPSHYETLNALKAKIAILLEENRKLQSEYDLLEEQYQQWQQNVDTYRNEVGTLIGESVEKQKRQLARKHSFQVVDDELTKLESDVLLKESKITYLKGQILDMEDKQKIKDLQLADLQYQQRELDMEWKMEQFELEEAIRHQQEEIEELKMQLRRNLEKEKELYHSMSNMQKESKVAPEKIQQLQKENRELEQKIGELETLAGLKKKEIDLFKDKRLLARRTAEHDIWQTEQERLQWEQKVQKLEGNFDALNATIEKTLSDQSRKRTLVEDVLRIDKENQELQSRITELQNRLREAQ